MPHQQKFTAADLIPGQTYRVIISFKDYDGIMHRAGESWLFVRKDFLPYEDGLTLHIERHGQAELLRLQWRPEAQGQIIDNFFNFVEAV